MIKYVIYDMTTTEVFDTEEEARQRIDEWIEGYKDCALDALKSADPGQVLRWDMEADFYRSNQSIDVQCRLLKVDTDVYDEDIKKAPFYEGMEDGIERLDYWWTDNRTLLGDEVIDKAINSGELEEDD